MGGYRRPKPMEPRGPWRPTVRHVLYTGEVIERPWDSRDWALALNSRSSLDVLVAVRRLRDILYQTETVALADARAQGYQWFFIAAALGVTPQAAESKWARRRGRPRSVGYPAVMSLDDLYREVILDHYRSPRNKHGLDGSSIDVHRNNPLCGDDITIHVAMGEGVATDAAFEGQGCSISQASASMLTEQIKGKTVEQIDELVTTFRKMMAGELDPSEDELGDLVALKGVVKYPVRIKCAVLAWDALQEGTTAVQH